MAEIVLAGCVIRNTQGKILLLHRYGVLVQWELPGGKVEEGEDPRDAAIREMHEELQCRVILSGQAFGEARFEEGGKVFRYIWFKAELLGSDKPTLGEPEKFDELRYWSVAELKSTQEILSPNMRNLIQSGLL